MIDLKFVQDDGLRKSLEDDFREIESAFSNGSWKSVHVLSGSIIEALLIETILSIDPNANRNKILKYTLEEAINDGVSRGIIGTMEEKLSYVVKGYRNLIHPGRIVRLSERVDKETASIALSLVKLISGKIGSEQAKRIGYTSDQVIAKISRDHRGLSISSHLLEAMSDSERIKLTTSGIFNAIIQDEPDQEGYRANAEYYGQLFKLAVQKISQDDMKKLGGFYARVVREEPIGDVALFIDHIFSVSDTQKFNDQDGKLILDYAISVFSGERSHKFNLFAGFSALPDNYLNPILDALYLKVINEYSIDEVDEAIGIVNRENYVDDSRNVEAYDLMNSKNESWKKTLENGIAQGKNWHDNFERLERFIDNAIIMPF